MSVQQEEIETSKMSDKELITYLMKKNAQLEQKNLKTEEKLKNALSKAKDAEKRAHTAENQLAANIVVMRKGLENINEIISRLQ